jgi:L-alanine-DL-glutamate epimerase-like enolase superfamily enzyme
MEYAGEFWEERLVRPLDLYPEHRNDPFIYPAKLSDGRYQVDHIYLEIVADNGLTGCMGPIGADQAFIIGKQIAPFLIGQDPLATERIWDIMYRAMVHGARGVVMIAISAVDCALWDLKGKWAGVPVYRLLGGPVRETIPAYASMLGYSLEPALVRQRSAAMVEQGYGALKWFFRHGPASGAEGMARNVELARTVREAVGSDVDIMLDCWMSWDQHYAVEMARRLEEYRPRWLEEIGLPYHYEQLAEIRRRIAIPVATGEHEYTRWGVKSILDVKCCDVLQVDLCWAGGFTEMIKICALASAYDVPVIPHGHLAQATVHLLAAQPASVCPLLEYLLKWQTYHQYLLKYPIKPVHGVVSLPDRPGLSMELDDAKIDRREELRF